MAETTQSLFEKTELYGKRSYLHGLLPALQRLDTLLERAVIAAQAAFGPEAAGDRYRRLYVSTDEVERLLDREPGTPALWVKDEEPLPEATHDGTSRLAWLQRACGLSSFEVDVLLIALAPELDRRYERLYAYLQDHVARRRPSVDLALDLLCSDAAARLESRVHFDPDAPLIHNDLIHLTE